MKCLRPCNSRLTDLCSSGGINLPPHSGQGKQLTKLSKYATKETALNVLIKALPLAETELFPMAVRFQF